MKTHYRWLLPFAAVVLALTVSKVKASPYASCITNNGGTISFFLNESGGNVVVTYEDGTTNLSFDGIDTGTNLLSGLYDFSMGGHSSYAIAVSKIGTGVPGLASNAVQNANGNYLFITGNERGVAVNENPTSPYFGRLYLDRAIGVPTAGIFAFNADGTMAITEVTNLTPGSVQWATNSSFLNTYSPYKMTIAPDDSLWLSDMSSAGSTVWRIGPNIMGTNVALAPVGAANGFIAGSHVTEESQPIVLFTPTSTNLFVVDGDYGDPSVPPFNANESGITRANSILVYSNIYSTLQSGGWETAPSIWGPCVGLSNFSGGYIYSGYIGLASGGNGYLYASQYRSGVTAGDPAFVQVYNASNLVLAWSSRYNGGSNDYFFTKQSGGTTYAPIDISVSPDGQYLATLAIDNHWVICALTNGIPDVTTMKIVSGTSVSQNARGLCWDAADNIYTISSGTALLQQWTLGLSTTYTTYGNLTGVTNFNSVSLNSSISVYATNNSVISQQNSYGNPTNGTFTIVRSGGDINSSLTVNFAYSGTASNSTYTAGSSGKIVFAPGQTTTNISISAVSDNIPRQTIYLTLTVTPESTYDVFIGSATISIMNTAMPTLIPSVGASSMYNAFSNDYVSVVITRIGDTNTIETVDASGYTLTGTAAEGTDYTTPTSVTFNPGDLTQTVYFNPLVGGQVPTHNPNLTYTGNKTITVKVANGGNYNGGSGSVTLNILDSAYPPATVLYFNPLTNAMDATNWNMTAANDNLSDVNWDVDQQFGYNIYTQPALNYYNGYQFYPLPAPPNGASNVLLVTVNKLGGIGLSGGIATAVNFYMTNQVFSGNYAVRFNMNVIEGDCTPVQVKSFNPEEYVLFGINHNGTQTNLFFPSFALGETQTNFASDGIWYGISDSGGRYDNALTPYEGFIGNGSPTTNVGWASTATAATATYATQFKGNVFTCYASDNLAPHFNGGWTEGGPGLPVNGPQTTETTQTFSESSWADVEIKQIGRVDSLWIDKTEIMSYTNNTGLFTNGYAMLGYEDPYDGGETPDTAAYFSNLRVVALTPPAISGAVFNSPTNKFTFDFTTSDGDLTPSNFTVYGSTNLLTTAFSAVSGASISAIVNPPGGVPEFQATVPITNSIHFYRIIQH